LRVRGKKPGRPEGAARPPGGRGRRVESRDRRPDRHGGADSPRRRSASITIILFGLSLIAHDGLMARVGFGIFAATGAFVVHQLI